MHLIQQLVVTIEDTQPIASSSAGPPILLASSHSIASSSAGPVTSVSTSPVVHVNVTMQSNPSIVITLPCNSSVAKLRNLACMQWGVPVSRRTRVTLKYNGVVITNTPSRHIITVGIGNNSIVEAQLYGLGGAGPKVKKSASKSKSNETEASMAMIRTNLKIATYQAMCEQTANKVSDEAKKVHTVKLIDQALSDFAHKVKDDAAGALMSQAMKLSVDELVLLHTSLSDCGSGNAEDKFKKHGYLFFGQNTVALTNYIESFQQVIASSENMLIWAFLKAQNKDPKYTLRTFFNMLNTVISMKQESTGAASSSGSTSAAASGAASDPLTEAITMALANVKM